MDTFSKNPLEYLQIKDLELRSPYNIDVRWNFNPPTGGKPYKLYVRVKPHFEQMVQYFGIMSTDELYRLLQGIEDGIVPKSFQSLVQLFLSTKQKGGFITKVDLTELELFDYNNRESFGQKNKLKSPQNKNELIQTIPELHPKIPVATSEYLRKWLSNAQ